MRNLAQLVMVGLAILLMWSGPKLQGWLAEGGGEGAAAAPPVTSPDPVAPRVDSTSMDDFVAADALGGAVSYEADPTCSRIRTCGDGVIDSGEDCDGMNLNGATCTSLGFTGDCGGDPLCLQASLTCTESCRFDLRGCTAARGDEPARFVDNGDGTVTDRLTNLMWEKKCQGAGCSFDHNVHTKLDWKGAASWWVEKLNRERLRGYAGHANWRLPTIRELQTLLVEPWPCRSNPCIDEKIFGVGLTGSGPYWSGISLTRTPALAWHVAFNNGRAEAEGKRTTLYVRAVRAIGVDAQAANRADDLGIWSDGRVDPGCSWVRLCGNGLLDATERCDGLDLDGQTCTSMGFSGDCGSDRHCIRQSLSCSAACAFDFTGCSSFSGTGRERFVERGDGTITDRLTGLMWERKCSGEGCSTAHDADTKLAWRTAASQWIDELNAEQGGGYGGYHDWRLPSIAELRSLMLDPWPCEGPCLEPALLGLESVHGRSYWSSTTFDADKSSAWSLFLDDGETGPQSKREERYVLAVRSGVGHAVSLLASR